MMWALFVKTRVEQQGRNQGGGSRGSRPLPFSPEQQKCPFEKMLLALFDKELCILAKILLARASRSLGYSPNKIFVLFYPCFNEQCPHHILAWANLYQNLPR